MVKITRYEFDGELLTAGQISKRYPAYSPPTIAKACAAGCKSLADLQARDRACKARIAKAQTANASRMPPIVLSASDKRRASRKDVASMGLRS
jgi:hypothetical protein